MSSKESGLFGAPRDRAIWRGRSLAFIRQVVGQEARYPDCRAALQASTLNTTDDPPVGAFCWYSQNPYDNVALAVGPFQVLAVDLTGAPMLTGIKAPFLGRYLGWSHEIGADHEGETSESHYGNGSGELP